MMVVGLIMVLATVLITVFTEIEPLPTALGVIGVVFVAVGSRQRRRGC